MATLCGERRLKADERATAFRVALEVRTVDLFGTAEIASAHHRGAQRLARREIPRRRVVVRERVLGDYRVAQPPDRARNVAAREREAAFEIQSRNRGHGARRIVPE